MNKKIFIGSRGSKLALLYAQKAKNAIIKDKYEVWSRMVSKNKKV